MPLAGVCPFSRHFPALLYGLTRLEAFGIGMLAMYCLEVAGKWLAFRVAGTCSELIEELVLIQRWQEGIPLPNQPKVCINSQKKREYTQRQSVKPGLIEVLGPMCCRMLVFILTPRSQRLSLMQYADLQ